MNSFIWILQGVLAFAFLCAGALKILRPTDRLAESPRMGWALGLSGARIKLLGAAEILGALGVIEPWATGILPVLTPIASACLFVLMVGAAVVHLRRQESAALPAILSAAAATVAFARFAELARR